MPSEWRSLLRGVRDMRVRGDEVEVVFAEGRHHLVTIGEYEGALRVTGIVTRSRDVAQRATADFGLWRRHRVVPFVRFGLDRHARLVGESWVPTAGLSATELEVHVRAVAAECDRLEQALTGRDDE